MNIVTLPSRSTLPALGLGTWHFGETSRRRADEVAALRLAFEIGYRVVDTAEMYGDGGAEEVLGQALGEAIRSGTIERDDVFIVSKVLPQNASRAGVVAACARSRRRLALDRIDLYLLHCPGSHPLSETLAGFEILRSLGHIRHWGVSNFDVARMQTLSTLSGGAACAANQVYYSIGQRGPEFDLLPWQRDRSMPLMAYCPLDRGDLATDATLQAAAERHGATASQVALAWLMSREGVIAIPKAGQAQHLHENFAAAELMLTAADHAALEARFPAPKHRSHLEMR